MDNDVDDFNTEELLKIILNDVPGYIFWKDTNSVYKGCNKNGAALYGADSPEDVVGKTDTDFNQKFASEFIKQDQYVVETDSPHISESDIVTLANGEILFVRTEKKPLRNKAGKIIGVLGNAVDLTLEKKAEQLRLKQQEDFRRIAAQVAHDIGSPLASLKMIIPHCTTLPETTRNALNKAATRISDIAENFLSQFRPKHDDNLTEINRIPTLIMAEILEILTEKKYQYNKLSIDFITNISQSGAFAFINIDTVSFKRMLSNLINNAVDALEGKIGEITIGLDVIDTQVLITVTDNGKGMSKEVKNKILANIEVTSGKNGGHGIGFMQIRETLHNNEGKFDINSNLDVGTEVKITFPKIDTPNWMAKSIELNNDDLVIILDDDDSIHSAWEIRFEKAAPCIKRYHFKQGNEAIEFVTRMPAKDREKIFLLTDYELLKQGLHGLDIIEKTGIKRSILVTSHHNNQLIRDKAMLINTKILPKLLAPEIIINYI